MYDSTLGVIMKYSNFLVMALLLALSTTVVADNSSGCGLGWQVFPKNSLVSSAFRTTTHIILPNTFSMTFGTSGCSRHDIVQNEKKGIHFAESNFHQLMIDMAKGEGEYLQGFAKVTGYSGDIKIYGEYIKSNYDHIFPKPGISPAQMYENYKNLMTIRS